MTYKKPIPVIDLFAGPGGLGEGFSDYQHDDNYVFKIGLSVEKDPVAHKTLELRSFYRQFMFDGKRVPDEYYAYLKGDINRKALFELYPEQAKKAGEEAKTATLGETETNHSVDKWINRSLGKKNKRNWVLIGGPPCQAYSLAGRSRNRGKDDYVAEKDERHFLYKEYLRIIAMSWPSVFVMENVKGLLSAKVNKRNIFDRILKDLEDPATGGGSNKHKHKYKIYSIVRNVKYGDDSFKPRDCIVKSEKYGIPQARHRIIIIGVRDDIDVKPGTLDDVPSTSVWDVISDLPKLRSDVSNRHNKITTWKQAIKSIPKETWYKELADKNVKKRIKRICSTIDDSLSTGAAYVNHCEEQNNKPQHENWYLDRRLNGVVNHKARTHMPSDLHRYLFCTCYTEVLNEVPRLKDFPKSLLPNHQNVEKALDGKMFADRFRVQKKDSPSTTITSHLSKDGHYFIHPDPQQCRTLTVREAARLQTFPDNYCFEGNHTEQYKQVGNAVPPLLARQVAKIVYDVILNSELT